jgi:enediyne biosynthesis protein E4
MSEAAGPTPRRGLLWLATGLMTGVALGVGAIVLVGTLADPTTSVAGPAPSWAEETATAGIHQVYDGDFDFYVGGGVAVFDCDGDRKPDLYVAGGSRPAALFLNRSPVGGDLAFDALPAAETDITGVTGAYPIDIDSDGVTDLVVLRNGPNAVLRGLGDCRFEPAADSWGIEPGDEWTAAFSATWSDGDALPTLAFGNYLAREDDADHSNCADNFLVRPYGGAYRDRTALSPGWCTLSVLFSDWGDKGQTDLRMTNDRHYYVDGEEQLWDTSREIPLQYGSADGWKTMQIWGMGIASQDVTGDGLPEVFLTSQGDNKLQTLADGPAEPAYDDIALAAGVTAHRPFVGDNSRPSTAWHAEFDDANNDGIMDILITKGNVEAQEDFAADDPNNLLIGQADGTFVEGAGDTGFLDLERSRGGALTDLNLDGLLDIVVVERREPVRVWRNLGASDGSGQSWLAISLQKEAPNRDAIGSWIEVKTGGKVTRREITIGGGHAGGELGWTHFGLGDAAEADVRVVWPGGETGRWETVPANQFLIADHVSGELRPWAPVGD